MRRTPRSSGSHGVAKERSPLRELWGRARSTQSPERPEIHVPDSLRRGLLSFATPWLPEICAVAVPTAYAVGYLLSPLRGSPRLVSFHYGPLLYASGCKTQGCVMGSLRWLLTGPVCDNLTRAVSKIFRIAFRTPVDGPQMIVRLESGTSRQLRPDLRRWADVIQAIAV
jgi:hypothetical protein